MLAMTNWDACCLVIEEVVYVAQYLRLKLLRLDRLESPTLLSSGSITNFQTFGWEV